MRNVARYAWGGYMGNVDAKRAQGSEDSGRTMWSDDSTHSSQQSMSDDYDIRGNRASMKPTMQDGFFTPEC